LPSRKELADRLDQLERDLLIFATGGGAGAALTRSPLLRRAAGGAALGLGRAAGGAALRLSPAMLLADLVIRQEESFPYQAGELVAEAAHRLDAYQARQPGPIQFGAGMEVPMPKKRKVSKANRAVAYAMKLLKSGTKAFTGADKGKLPKGAFGMAVKAAGLANPRTGGSTKGKGKTKALARKIRSWWI